MEAFKFMTEKRLSVLIVQNKIMHYRKPLYNKMADSFNVTVLHSGEETVTVHDNYFEIISPKFSIGPFVLQKNVRNKLANEYDVVICMFDPKWLRSVILLLFRRNKPFIWWGIGFGKNKLANKFRVLLSKIADAVILYNKNSMQNFTDKGISQNKVFVANNTFHVAPRVPCFNCKKTSVLFIGTLDERKELDKVIQTFSALIPLIPPSISLDIIGDGVLLNDISNLIKSLNLEKRVFLHGKITDTSLLVDYYKKAFCSVSYGQAGLSVLQSLAYGVPFITKKNAVTGGELNNIEDGINGYLLSDDLDDLRSILSLLINDGSLSKQLGKNAYDYYSRYATIENMVFGFEQAIAFARENYYE